jgi:hypothetical protein
MSEELNIDINEIDELSNESINNKEVEWREEHEKILIEWADKAMCYRWLHSRSYTIYSRKYAWYTIPVIIISTITGVGNFAQDRFPPEYATLGVLLVGALNIIAGIIGTIQQFLKISQFMESHRVSSIAWDKFYRNIKIELAKHPSERFPANQLLKISKEEYDRLMETSPDIPDIIKSEFKTTFKESSEFAKISKPEILDYLVGTAEFKYIDRNPINPVVVKENETIKKNMELKRNFLKIKNFCTTFKQIHGRDALADEIKEQFERDIDSKELNNFINKIEKNNLNNIEMETVLIKNKDDLDDNHPRLERANSVFNIE